LDQKCVFETVLIVSTYCALMMRTKLSEYMNCVPLEWN